MDGTNGLGRVGFSVPGIRMCSVHRGSRIGLQLIDEIECVQFVWVLGISISRFDMARQRANAGSNESGAVCFCHRRSSSFGIHSVVRAACPN